jgi:hypothetical protein
MASLARCVRPRTAVVRPAVDHQVEQRAQSRQPAQVAVIAETGVAPRRFLADVDLPEARRRVAERPGQDGQAWASE